MQLKSLEKVLDGIGRLRAASLVAAAASSAAFLGLHLSAGVQQTGLIGTTILLAVVNGADGYIRGQHAAALPALIGQGAESVGKVQDPRLDDIAQAVDVLTIVVDGLRDRKPAPTLPEIIAALTGKPEVAPAETAPVVDPAAPSAPVTPPAA